MTKPGVPEILTVSASGTTITLSWAINTRNEQQIEVQRYDGGAWRVVATLPAGTTQYQDANLAPRTTYYYVIRALNALGASAYSPTVSAKTGTAPVPTSGWVFNFSDAAQSGGWALVG